MSNYYSVVPAWVKHVAHPSFNSSCSCLIQDWAWSSASVAACTAVWRSHHIAAAILHNFSFSLDGIACSQAVILPLGPGVFSGILVLVCGPQISIIATIPNTWKWRAILDVTCDICPCFSCHSLGAHGISLVSSWPAIISIAQLFQDSGTGYSETKQNIQRWLMRHKA